MSEGLIRIGVTGSGFMGRTHVEASRRAAGAEIVAVAGGRRAPGLADDYGIDCVETVEDLIRRDDIDAIISSTPHHCHVDETLQAAGCGKHVLVEKPLCQSIDDSNRIIREARQAKGILMIGFELREASVFSSMKQLLDEGRIGPVKIGVKLSYQPASNIMPGTTVVITATFDRKFTGTPSIGINTQGPDVSGVVMTATGDPLVWVFTYVVPEGTEGLAEVSLSGLNGGTNNQVVSLTNNSFLITGNTTDLSVGVTASAETAVRNGTLTYTITVVNRGPATTTALAMIWSVDHPERVGRIGSIRALGQVSHTPKTAHSVSRGPVRTPKPARFGRVQPLGKGKTQPNMATPHTSAHQRGTPRL